MDLTVEVLLRLGRSVPRLVRIISWGRIRWMRRNHHEAHFLDLPPVHTSRLERPFLGVDESRLLICSAITRYPRAALGYIILGRRWTDEHFTAVGVNRII